MENRKYTRLPLDVMVELHLTDGTILYGETTDISLDGAFINISPPDNARQGESCKLVLIINSEEGWVRVEFHSIIAHKQDEGIGVRFESANAAHHESFLKLLIDGAKDIEQILHELSQNPGKEFGFSNQ
jgi:hypothetical protein